MSVSKLMFLVVLLLLAILNLRVCLPEVQFTSNRTVEEDAISAFQIIDLSTRVKTTVKNEILLKNVDFGSLGASGLTLYTVQNPIEIRIGDQEIILETNFETQSKSGSLEIKKTVNIQAGIHDVLITVPNGLNEIKSIQFYNTAQPNQDIWYVIIADGSGKALDMGRGVRYGRITQYKYRNEANQKFRFKEVLPGYYKIEVKNSGLVLEAKDFGRNNHGTPVQTNDFKGWDNQLWSLEITHSGLVRIRVKHSTHCLDVYLNSKDDGANVVTHICIFSQAQNFLLVPAS